MPGARRLIAVVFCTSLSWLAVLPDAFATLVLPAELDEIVAGSQTIVHGRVSSVDSRMASGRRSIESVVTVEVLSALKGEPRASVAFRVPNGRVGRYRRITVGAPELAPGDEIVVFLRGRAPAVPVPFGLTQGVYRVSRSAAGAAMVMPPAADGPARIVRGDPSRRPIPIDAFTRRIRSMVAP